MTDPKKRAEPPEGLTIPVDPVLIALVNNMLTLEEIKEAVESGKKEHEEMMAKRKAAKEE